MAEETSIRREGSLAIVTIDNPPVNALSAGARAGLLGAMQVLSGDPSVAAVLIRCAGRTFVAGADIREFDTGVAEPTAREVFTFTMSDMGGNDVALRARETSGIRAHRPGPYNEVADELARRGRLGPKTGAGFYRYEPGSRTPIPDPASTAIIEEVARRFGIERRTVNDEEIEVRCIYPLINEGAKILAEGIAYRPGDIDVIWTTGYGFPRLRGGPLFYADTLGLANVYAEISRLHGRLGHYWQPAPLLKQLAQSSRTFTQWSTERQ